LLAIAGIWEWKSRTDPAPHRDTLTEAARHWLRHRYERRMI
jgi:putative SOS response-associated peptidase YedK